ncbi:MAG: galactokinase [Candidatus Euphemobacter frigidus]|nr:galactokinase [Candidatus Euphemobacter frigidus]MDP8275238.1 galactokinase [Candidatus Euphemobacter frigidus]
MEMKSVIKRFNRYFPGTPRVFMAPGRVNLIGEHTDYNEGFVLPMALEYRAEVAVSPRADRRVRVRSQNLDESITFSLNENERKRNHWSDYTAGVARMLELSGFRLPGADLLIESMVPVGAGLSSSAALEVASALALLSTVGGELSLTDLALLAQRAENEFVGMNCGIMDQFISVHGERDHALFLDCRSLEYQQVPLRSDQVSVIICNTRVKHKLGVSEYNTRRKECEEGVDLLKSYYPDITALRDLSPEEFAQSEGMLPEVIGRRCRHVVTEDQRVLESVRALREDDLARFGDLMNRSHESLRDDYEVSCRELDIMVDLARKIPGCLGARMTGGGFGGCTVNLVEAASVDAFQSAIRSAYREETGLTAEIYLSAPARGAHEVIPGLKL